MISVFVSSVTSVENWTRMTVHLWKVQQVLCVLLLCVLQLCSAETQGGGCAHASTRSHTFTQPPSYLFYLTWNIYAVLLHGPAPLSARDLWENTCFHRPQNQFCTRRTCLLWLTDLSHDSVHFIMFVSIVSRFLRQSPASYYPSPSQTGQIGLYGFQLENLISEMFKSPLWHFNQLWNK